MSEPELIVEFVEGTSEEDARACVEKHGCKVRRRMRTDSPEEVTLLVRAGQSGVTELQRALSSDPQVARTEINAHDFRAL